MATVTDFLAHAPAGSPTNEFFSFFGDGTTGYYGETFVARASNLTQIEFDIDPVLGGRPGTTDYKALVASVTLAADGSFLRPAQLLFESAPLSFTPDGVTFWQRVTVPVTGLSLAEGQTYVLLLNANFGGNEGGGDALVAGNGFNETFPGDPNGGFVFAHGNTGSTASDFRSLSWGTLAGDLAYRLTYDQPPPPPGMVLNGTNKDDNITGRDGDDVISGGNGADTIDGAGGNDRINGGNGNDLLFGDAGDDILDGGGNGADTLNGGSGNNTLTGGNGRDNFVFGSRHSGTTPSPTSSLVRIISCSMASMWPARPTPATTSWSRWRRAVRCCLSASKSPIGRS
jgi:Ca2+-binding RTX toxin-like protein